MTMSANNRCISRKFMKIMKTEKIRPNIYTQYCKQEFSKETLCGSHQNI